MEADITMDLCSKPTMKTKSASIDYDQQFSSVLEAEEITRISL
jgi:hypothetical protein